MCPSHPVFLTGRQYLVMFSDKHKGKSMLKHLSDGLPRRDQSQLLEKFGYYTTLYQKNNMAAKTV